MTIISTPSRVCVDHAIEFWTGVLGYSHARAGVCIRNEKECTCPRCVEMAEEFAKAAALLRVAPSRADRADFAIGIAS
jgi:hypothetical protein